MVPPIPPLASTPDWPLTILASTALELLEEDQKRYHSKQHKDLPMNTDMSPAIGKCLIGDCLPGCLDHLDGFKIVDLKDLAMSSFIKINHL